MSYEKQFWEHESSHEDDSDYREYQRLQKENAELKKQKEIDRQEIERLKEALIEATYRMTRAREIISERGEKGNWGMLDATKYIELIKSMKP
jgi:hypothetical protein